MIGIARIDTLTIRCRMVQTASGAMRPHVETGP